MTTLQEALAAEFGPLQRTVERLPERLIDQARASEYEKARTVKWMRLPQTVQGPAVSGTLLIGGDNLVVPCGPRPGYAWFITRLVVDGLSAGQGAQPSLTASGSVTDPGAGAAIATTAAAAAGTYVVTATVFLTGTVTAADGSNMQLEFGGTNQIIAYPGVANVPVTYTTTVVVPAGGHAISVNAIAAASGVSAVYNASISAQQQAVSADVVTLYRNSNVATQPPLWVFTGTNTQWTAEFGKARMTLLEGDTLTLAGSGISATGNVRLSGEMIEVAQERMGVIV